MAVWYCERADFMALINNLDVAFSSIVEQHGQRCALFYPSSGERISYAQLDELSRRLAAILHAKGLRRGQVVALFHDKSPAAYALMLACLRLGLIYTNLDPDSPWERLRKIIQVCEPSLVAGGFDELPFAAELTANNAATLHLRSCLESAAMPHPGFLPAINIDGSAPAYIMFTSGSTGTPKGAVMSHANVLWFSAWSKERFSISPDDVLTNVNPMYFDNSVFDFYSALLSGATLVPITTAQVRDTRLLVSLVNQAGCTLWFSVPSLLVYLLTTRALSETDWPAMRSIVFGGEGFPKTRLRQLHALFGQRTTLENVYGPTECTCICSAYTITSSDFDDMHSLAPLGTLNNNFDFDILTRDETGPDCGELFLRGPQVGLGYYNEPQRSIAAFVQNPRHGRYADTGYRTGDIVRRDAHGLLHFKGRADFQIKHMGYRIELEEIEAALGSIDGVMECAVTYQQGNGTAGHICAFAVINTTSTPLQLQQVLATIVPPYMLPRQLTILPSLPKNANGKIDRQALAFPTTSSQSQ